MNVLSKNSCTNYERQKEVSVELRPQECVILTSLSMTLFINVNPHSCVQMVGGSEKGLILFFVWETEVKIHWYSPVTDEWTLWQISWVAFPFRCTTFSQGLSLQDYAALHIED